MQRREFIRNLAVSGLALSAGGAGRLFAGEALPPVGREGWSGAAFANLKDERFQVRSGEAAQHLYLEDVTHGRRDGVESAALRFRGASQARLAEGTYLFSHPALGEMPVFIVPGKIAGGRCFYQATFARFV